MEITKSSIISFIKSKILWGIIAFFFVMALVVGAFGLGIVIGYHKASFSYRWGENYHRNFGGPRGGLFNNFWGDDFVDGHGIAGQIIKIDGIQIIIKGRDNVEKVIVTNEDTLIRGPKETLRLADLKLDDTVVIIGQPNDQGQIEAKFIRVVPAQNSPTSSDR